VSDVDDRPVASPDLPELTSDGEADALSNGVDALVCVEALSIAGLDRSTGNELL
jgi:hypothetical protein